MNKIPHYKIDESLLIPQRNRNICKNAACVLGIISLGCSAFMIFFFIELNKGVNSNSTLYMDLYR